MRHWHGEAKRKEHKRVSTSLQEEPKHGDAGKREASEGMRVQQGAAHFISAVRAPRARAVAPQSARSETHESERESAVGT